MGPSGRGRQDGGKNLMPPTNRTPPTPLPPQQLQGRTASAPPRVRRQWYVPNANNLDIELADWKPSNKALLRLEPGEGGEVTLHVPVATVPGLSSATSTWSAICALIPKRSHLLAPCADPTSPAATSSPGISVSPYTETMLPRRIMSPSPRTHQ